MRQEPCSPELAMGNDDIHSTPVSVNGLPECSTYVADPLVRIHLLRRHSKKAEATNVYRFA